MLAHQTHHNVLVKRSPQHLPLLQQIGMILNLNILWIQIDNTRYRIQQSLFKATSLNDDFQITHAREKLVFGILHCITDWVNLWLSLFSDPMKQITTQTQCTYLEMKTFFPFNIHPSNTGLNWIIWISGYLGMAGTWCMMMPFNLFSPSIYIQIMVEKQRFY